MRGGPPRWNVPSVGEDPNEEPRQTTRRTRPSRRLPGGVRRPLPAPSGPADRPGVGLRLTTPQARPRRLPLHARLRNRTPAPAHARGPSGRLQQADPRPDPQRGRILRAVHSRARGVPPSVRRLRSRPASGRPGEPPHPEAGPVHRPPHPGFHRYPAVRRLGQGLPSDPARQEHQVEADRRRQGGDTVQCAGQRPRAPRIVP